MNLKITIIITIVAGLLNACKVHRDKLCVTGIVERIAPQFANDIEFKQIDSPSGKDIFELESLPNGKIMIRGNNPVSMSMGFNHYLKYYCKTSVSWFVDQRVQLPKTLPEVPMKIRKEALVPKRFFLNYCTYGYTMPWWKWKDWERLIDWMALNGINMPLAIAGQETIWYKVWQDFGLTDEEIRSYFTGPAYLPWHRMSNIDNLGGPLPQSWMDHQFALQKKILKRERSLGMTPVLPAFNGHVPGILIKIYPDAKISKLGSAGDFENPFSCHILDPMDSLFRKIQKAYLEEQTRQFGTDHIYSIDPLNEIRPPSWESDYLADLSGIIYNSISEMDPEAEWLQMGWMFYFSRKHWSNERIKAFLTAVPQGKMILLDYFCDNTEVWKFTESFYGQPYIWCYLGNFGGNTLLAGNMAVASKRLDHTLQNSADNMIGIGSTLEGLDVNPMVYEYIFEKAWGKDSTDLNEWFDQWADRRCGYKDEHVREAWQILLKNVYSSVPTLAQVSFASLRPAFPGSDEKWVEWSPFNYSNATLFHAWELMFEGRDQTRDTYQYDIVNIGRQVLANHFDRLLNQFTDFYKVKDLDSLKATGAKMEELLEDLDKLLSTRHSFLLGKWIEDARQFGKDSSEANYYEKNARNLLTTWGVKGNPLTDYANRSWGGLTKTYNAKRWKMFIAEVVDAVLKKEDFNEKVFLGKVMDFEINWAEGTEKYPSQPVGNSVEIASQLMKKYHTQIAND